MAQPLRLAAGGRVDRGRTLRFTFDGRTYTGHPGDTLASALLANGVRLLGRSYKYHRPRGLYSAGAEEPSALVTLGAGARAEPNTRATQVELFDGLVARSQNAWPALGFDVSAVIGAFSRFLPAGFYYKTFMWPKSLWMTYEKVIRDAAGPVHGPRQADPDRYEQRYAHCDVLVVGAGPAGLMAALAAGRTGARVILADDQPEAGGGLLTDPAGIGGGAGLDWVRATVAALADMPEVTVLPRTTVVGYHDYNYLGALERVTDHLPPDAGGNAPRQRLWKIRAKQVVLATGAIERPLVFADNDRPGVMLAGAARTYMNRFGVLPGREMVVFTNNDGAYATALDAASHGARVQVVDLRPDPRGPLPEAAREAGIPIHAGATVCGVAGSKAVTGVRVRALSDDGKGLAGPAKSLPCSVLAMSGGWTPTVHLFSQARGKLAFSADLGAFVPAAGDPLNPNRPAGACNGSLGLDACLREGREAGLAAAHDTGHVADHPPDLPLADSLPQEPPRLLWTLPAEKAGTAGEKTQFVDLMGDVTVADVRLAEREGYASVEHLKRYTATGMGTDQGKTSNINAMAIMADARGVTIPEVGHTTFRPNYVPVAFGAVAGRSVGDLFQQARPTAMHEWHVAQGAVFEDVGDWKRPWYFPRPGETMHDAVQRECKAVRTSVGIVDASTLGKIDIQGPDAADLLNMVYTNAWSKLGIGRCRYGVMLNEHGMIFDDGVTTRLGEHHYHMTTTTGGAARVMSWLEEWLQTEWPDMRVFCTSVTEQWAVAALNGPRSRELLAGLTDIDLDPETFPFMAMKEGTVAGIPARVYRISFTGEMAYEVNVPAGYGLALWQALMDRGAAFDICPYGTETMHVLRAEKGFIIAGQDTDGTVTPHDAAMDWIVSKKKADFIGRRSLFRADTMRPGRMQLVGLLTEDPAVVLPEGAQVAERAQAGQAFAAIGHVTSSYMSPNVGRSIALAMVADGFNRTGQTLSVPTLDGRVHRAVVGGTVFFDPEGERARG
ncbi:MAG: sarcosine oxidase subunit alpha family protein [Hyphomicrobiales bacterium]|nr:sarcosine oxidase subunit alpha family protein [Hyphomicrobiales bacterium]